MSLRGAGSPSAKPKKRVSLALAGLERGEVLTGPQTVHVDVTNGCNTNCITCWDHSPLLTIGRTSAWKRQRIDVAALEGVLDDAASLGGLEAIILSGMGEPFTHPGIYEMIAAVKRRGLHLTIITNLVAADVEQIIALGVDQLLIGVQGASRASYEAFHPSFKNGEWDRLLGMLARLREAGRRFKHVQVVCEVNAHELVDMVRLAKTYDASLLNFKLAGLKGGTETCRVTDAQRRELESSLVPEARRVARDLGVDTNLDVFEAQLSAGGEATAPIRDVGCFIGQTYARVLVDGTVLYCCNTDVVVGHLAEARFSDLWRAERWNAVRARMRRGDYFDSCSQCGKIAQNVKLRARFEAAYGPERARDVTGGGAP